MGYEVKNSQQGFFPHQPRSHPAPAGIEGFYGPDEYRSMIVQGKIAKGAQLIVLRCSNGSFMPVNYTALNQTEIKRGNLRENPQKVLDDTIWLVDKKHLNPLERMSVR